MFSYFRQTARISFAILIFSAVMPLIAQAGDTIVPERRIISSENTDFYGGDLRTIFDTTLELCETAAKADLNAHAFTFNQSKHACFLKSEAGAPQTFGGAFSAKIVNNPTATVQHGAERAATLAFLPPELLNDARLQGEGFGLDYPVNADTAESLRAEVRKTSKNNDINNAYWAQATLVTITDSAVDWLQMAEFAANYDTEDKDTVRWIATAGAINAYLRANDRRLEGRALMLLADMLEKRGFKKPTVPTLELAQTIAPDADTLLALERVKGLYGFRVTDEQLDSNPAEARYCVSFSDPLVANTVDYSPYIRVEGLDNLPVEVEGRQLCVGGLRHGQRYHMTVRTGLPAANGQQTSKPVDLEFYVRDRDPSVRFIGKTYVLPKSADATIPLIGVNASEAALNIYRIGDRNLVRAIRNGLVGTQIDEYTAEDIVNTIGAEVWNGTASLSSVLNEDTTTALPLGEALGDMQAGIYAMTAQIPGDTYRSDPQATQWFIVTDLGLETLSGNDGLHVHVRSLATTAPLGGVKVSLLDVKNDVLDTQISDAEGAVHFPAGLTRGTASAAPALVSAETDGDYAFVDLGRPAFDLSDRGVTGRASPPPLDVFATTERGAYRPGETVHATLLVRDSGTHAVTDLPLTVVVTRPDGVEDTREVVADMGAGGRVFTLPLDAAAQRGTWRMRVYGDTQSATLVNRAFLVEDFQPEKLDFTLTLPETSVSLAQPPKLQIDATYLYGAPAAGLDIEAETAIRAVDGLPDYPGFVFGLQNTRFDTVYDSVSDILQTDDNGIANFTLPLGAVKATTRPLEANITVRVIDSSGAPVERRITRPIAPDGPRIGIKPLFDGVVDGGGLARFNIIAIDAGGRRAMGPVKWTLSRVNKSYQWYKLDGYWNYEPVITRTRVTSGDLTIGTQDPELLDAPVDWGQYELKLVAMDGSDTAAGLTFNAGWYGAESGSDTPDLLNVGLDQSHYRPGDTALLRVNARYDGKLVVRVASDTLIAEKTLDITAGDLEVPLNVTSEWGTGAYVVATLIRPMDAAAGRNPARALGLSYAATDPGKLVLSARILTPDAVDPRGLLQARIKIENAPEGETVYATIAAVDVGILNLTGFKAPAPAGYYFSQRRLGMEFRDVYGQLIDGFQGTRGSLRSGGDAGMQRRNAQPPTQKLVAFFSGPVMMDADGILSADFPLPAFNGTVRLMAVVWSKTAVGQANKDILVRDPVVVTATPPVFLAPNDGVNVSVDLTHTSGLAGDMDVSVSTNGNLSLLAGPFTRKLTFTEGGHIRFDVPLRAGDTGVGALHIALTLPDGRILEQDFPVDIRLNDPVVSRNYHMTLKPGESLTLDSTVLADMMPGTGSASLTVGPLARLDVAGLLQELDRYPYGCTEQQTSRALPLLYFDDVAAGMGLAQKSPVATRIDAAIKAVLANQSSSGSFGLWRPDEGDLWLDSYVTDFLSRARQKGYDVPDRAFRTALDNLRNQVNYAGDFENAGEDLAYALMVLAREKAASVGDLRYYADEKATAFATPLAQAQLGAALAYFGDHTRADRMFALAGKAFETTAPDSSGWRSDYGSRLRDAAAVLALVTEAGSDALDTRRLVDFVAGSYNRYRSTQENVWTLLAADALMQDIHNTDISVNGIAASGPVMRGLASGDTSVTIVRNDGTQAIDAVLGARGVPNPAEPASGDGYRISRRYFTLDGSEIAAGEIHRNDRIVVVVKVSPERFTKARLMVDDPLPAGLVIDNPHLLTSGDVTKLDWLKLDNVASHTEFRDDRFRAAVDWNSGDSFTLGYIVRAAYAGTFRQPAASVEDMYRPTYRAHTDTGTLTIQPAR